MRTHPALRVALAQANACVGDLWGNREKILKLIYGAKAARADLVIFPELAVTGYPPEDLLFQNSFIEENLKVLRSLLLYSQGIVAVVGFVDRDRRGRLYNAAAVLANGKLAGVYHKTQLPNYGVFDEKRYFAPGERGLVVEWPGVRLGLSICEDIWQPEAMFYEALYSRRISALVNISASPYHAGKQKTRERLVSRLAAKSRAAVFYVNLVGGQDELVFDGGSMIADTSGRILLRALRFQEQLAVADVPIPPKKFNVSRSNFLKLVKISTPWARKDRPALSAGPVHRELGREEEIYRALVLGTRDYVVKNGFKKVVVGLSGGIDSALVAAVAADALGPGNVVGVTLPSPFTSRRTHRDARRLARNLGVRLLEFSIGKIFSAYLETLKGSFAALPKNITEENLQSRIRGNILMALSNKFGYLVLTTGNKSELATGYCTLYGDTAGGFAVIKDVLKTEVYRLVRFLNAQSREARIPSSIVRRAPTAELRPRQKDTDTLPPYEVLDRFMECYVEKDMALGRIIKSGVPAVIVQKAARLVDANEYKRRQLPPGVKITPKAFGRDRRMPITNKFRG